VKPQTVTSNDVGLARVDERLWGFFVNEDRYSWFLAHVSKKLLCTLSEKERWVNPTSFTRTTRPRACARISSTPDNIRIGSVDTSRLGDWYEKDNLQLDPRASTSLRGSGAERVRMALHQLEEDQCPGAEVTKNTGPALLIEAAAIRPTKQPVCALTTHPTSPNCTQQEYR
jgi:hypothetical protein